MDRLKIRAMMDYFHTEIVRVHCDMKKEGTDDDFIQKEDDDEILTLEEGQYTMEEQSKNIAKVLKFV